MKDESLYRRVEHTGHGSVLRGQDSHIMVGYEPACDGEHHEWAVRVVVHVDSPTTYPLAGAEPFCRNCGKGMGE